MRIWRKIMLLSFGISLCASAYAELLWDNGENTGNIIPSNYYRVMDDFYVPGAGWWIDSAQVYGTFLNLGYPHQVDSVSIRIMAADPDSGEPDPGQGDGLVIVSFDETQVGDNGVRVDIDFQKMFLKGQRYYWIEFEVLDDDGYFMRGFQSADIKYLPAYGDFSAGLDSNLYELSEGLAFSLSGQDVKTVGYSAATDFTVEKLDNGDRSWTLNLVGEHKLFKPGIYQIQLERKLPKLYWFDKDGRHEVDDFAIEDPGAVKFTTPLGDDMCKNAPPILQQYCQSFVACAAYEFCGEVPIP